MLGRGLRTTDEGGFAAGLGPCFRCAGATEPFPGIARSVTTACGCGVASQKGGAGGGRTARVRVRAQVWCAPPHTPGNVARVVADSHRKLNIKITTRA